MHVGHEIRRLREAKEWSQAKLGVLSGTGPSGISQIETGRRNPSAATLQRIAEALEVDIAELFPKVEKRLWSDKEELAALESEAQQVLEQVRENRTRLESYMEAPPDEDVWNAALFEYYELRADRAERPHHDGRDRSAHFGNAVQS